MKLCRDCHYHYSGIDPHGIPTCYWYRENEPIISLVDGSNQAPIQTCDHERKGKCGPSGSHWVKRRRLNADTVSGLIVVAVLLMIVVSVWLEKGGAR